MEFRILGSMEVVDADRPRDLPSGRARALLALLVLHVGQVVTTERLIDDLWGEHPPTTANTIVQGLVSKLRKALEPGRAKGQKHRVIETVGTGYRLAVPDDSVDAGRFKVLLDEARLATGDARSRALHEALALWRGPALADFSYEPFAQRAIAALDELRLAATEDRIDADLAAGAYGDIVAEIEGLVAEHPLHERLRGQLMLALYRAGRQAEALDAFRAARDALVEDLGIDPSPALIELQRAILNQDPSLDAPAIGSSATVMEAATDHWMTRERRIVTVVYAASDPNAASDPEAERIAVDRSFAEAERVLRRHGARVEEVVGNLVLGLFGLPVAHEDDALRAVRAAVELKDAPGASWRIGIETGELVVGAGGSLAAQASGPALGRASELQRSASEGQVLVGPSTRRLVRGVAVLKPHDDLEASLVLEVTDARSIDPSLETPIVGRSAELTRLRSAFRSAVGTGTPQRLTVFGDPGIGKSRLSRAFAESIGPAARIITGRCPPYGEGITFLPLREALLELAGAAGWPALERRLADEPDGAEVAEQVAAAIGMRSRAGRPDRLFPAILRLVEVLARDVPLVLILEDLHWAESTFLDLLEYLERSATGPVFLLCLARPELLDARPLWSDGALVLEPLESEDVRQLVVDRADTDPAPELITRIVEVAQGNPLFAEQLLAGYDQRDVEEIPSSLQGLLAMRLDRLGPGERDMLRTAAVVGPDVTEDALEHLLPDGARSFLNRHLRTLEERRFIARSDPGIRFRHVLIRQAAYQSMTRSDRARLHERYADWLESGPSEAAPEIDELVGYHLQQAVEHARAIGRTDDALATRAGERLADAADRALARADLAAAEHWLAAARSMLPEDHARRVVVTRRLSEVGLPLGRHSRSLELQDEMVAAARAHRDRSSELYARIERARVQLLIGPDPVPLEAIDREADEALSYFTDAGDDAGLAQATYLSAFVRQRAGRVVEMDERLRASLAHADRSGQIREMIAARWTTAETLALGPIPVAGCIERCEALAHVGGLEVPGVSMGLGLLTAMSGRFEEARLHLARARSLVTERWRIRRLLKFIEATRGTVEDLAGDESAAERAFRDSLEIDYAIGEERDDRSQTEARLAILLTHRGRGDEAAELAEGSARTAPSESVAAQALSTIARALVLGDPILARRAVDLVPEEMPNLRGDLSRELAAILGAAGDVRGAEDVTDEAAGWYRLKGNVAALAMIGR